ncbi:hypothetical protein BGZ60DRAFT_567862 [Tricladium varicosporioides]|nr:hypothetical protein BGZ60DRAFT_567862 [Hymenoscyphus varicosporioides]
MDSTAEISDDHLKAPYAERWGLLKKVMARLYIDEGRKLKEIVEIMKTEYRFYASEGQYKRQFGLWNIKRALTSKKKARISKVLETRAQQGKSSVVLHNGREVDNEKIRRHLKEEARRDIFLSSTINSGAVSIDDLFGHALQCGNRVFMNWSMPGSILRFLKSKAVEHISPAASAGTPMSGIIVTTPSTGGPSPRNPPSPGNALSPNDAPSPMTTIAQKSLKIKRAHLFVQKHHKNLLQGMNLEEQVITTEWMHQFWQFSFRTARAWGRGPKVWDSSNLNFDKFPIQHTDSLHATPNSNAASPGHQSRRESPRENPQGALTFHCPSDLCYWSIHIRSINYDAIADGASPPPAENSNLDDPEDEETWKPWNTSKTIQNFMESLADNLESNRFSNIEVRNLPIASNQIAKAAKRSPEQLFEEAFGFSIMARNLELVYSMLGEINRKRMTLHDLYPLHLASTYLNGARTCCEVFDAIVRKMTTGESSVRKLYINHLNHTVLDALMISILKAHTSCTPVMVDEAFKNEPRFAGEEVDICGRWDADSNCIRHLQATRCPTIPFTWKHMFCHTSVQAIVHCIGTLFGPHWCPDINTPSGLYLKRCPNETCGLRLQLLPLHTLVVTAFYLAWLGSEGETLFGMLACLLCLLGKGANPLKTADVSLEALLDYGGTQECTHSKLTPLELAQRAPEDIISRWPKERQLGWRVFCKILELSQKVWDPQVKPQPEILPEARFSSGEFQIIYGDFFQYTSEQSFGNGHIPMDLEKERLSGDNENESEDENEDDDALPAYCSHHETDCNYFGQNRSLATLWAAIQTELLTYRRIAVRDPWISENFQMDSVLRSLEEGEDISIALVSKGMMKPFCPCGNFHGSFDTACTYTEEACAYYFSNLEDWNRSTFLDLLEGREDL